jgi:hypothetical protein
MDGPDMTNLTAAERATRYRQRKAEKKVPASPRAARRADIEMLWMIDCMCSNQRRSLRTFYRRRSTVLRFAQHAQDETMISRLTDASEVLSEMRIFMLVAEWNDFLARAESLGIQVENKRHPLDPEALDAPVIT